MKITHELVRAFLMSIETSDAYYYKSLVEQMLEHDYISYSENSCSGVIVPNYIFSHPKYTGNAGMGWLIKKKDLIKFNRQRNIDNFLKYTSH